MEAKTSLVVAFSAGIALGSCVALAIAGITVSAQGEGSFRKWKVWRLVGLKERPPASGPSEEEKRVEPREGRKPEAHEGSRSEVDGNHNSEGLNEPASSRAGTTSFGAKRSVADRVASGDDILNEQFTRNRQFFGEEAQLAVHRATVVVIGLGGVGSHAAAMLLRSGVGRIRIVDFDQVSLSSINRHAVATRADVGTSKAVCLRKHFKRIFPEAEIDARVLMFEPASEEEVLGGSPDFVLDCIDNIDTKVALLAACVRRGLRVLSATGAGARADPTRIRIADLSESTVDPLSRTVRHRLRREHGIEKGIPVVFSTEKPKAKLLPFEAPEGAADVDPLDYQVVPGFRVRVIPVLGTIPAMFGQAMATYVLTQLAGLAVPYEPLVQLGGEHYAMLHSRLVEREELAFGTAAAVDVDLEEVAYVVRELWRGRSARNQEGQRAPGRGMWGSMANCTLTRWDASRPPSIDNLVLLTFQEAEEHEMGSLVELKEREPAFVAMVDAVLARARKEFR
eukprot:TRINITY_DN21073_c0_g1_i1.p1 TRINITY_DN21073_c0_g1~~TRINITY_DN21073_c0_g1_i1.p1  ORF type:complete len:509 (-),score=86.57 TRINITY_DN21073_c0_g1_i1:440-1966(-)